MKGKRLNPFLYGKPVPFDRFVGRGLEVKKIFERIYNGESTAIVGQPHIGKSSLIGYITDEETKKEWMDDTTTHAFVEIDSHLLSESDQPVDFWQQVLSQIETVFPDEVTLKEVQNVARGGFGNFPLKDFFATISKKGRRVVLLIDEFDALLHHPKFNTAYFLGALRSISTITRGGLVLITASRLSITEMNRLSRTYGSPFFNTLSHLLVPPLGQPEVDKLLDQALDGSGVTFSQRDRIYLRVVAGRHPYLLQVASATLFDSIIQEKKPDEERYQDAGRILQSLVAPHFDDLWKHLSPSAQTVSVVFSTE